MGAVIQRPLDKKEFRKKAQSAVPVSKEKARKSTVFSFIYAVAVISDRRRAGFTGVGGQK